MSQTNGRFFLNSLKLTFLHITPYELDYNWRIGDARRIPHDVLWCLEEGEIRFTVNGIPYGARAGQLILLPPQSDITSYAVSSRVRLTSINFLAELSLTINRKWSDVLKLPVLYSGYNMAIIKPVIDSLLADAAEESFAQAILLQSGLERLFALMLNQYYDAERVDQLPGLDPRVQAVMAYLSMHPDYSGEVTALCELFQVSESYLRKLFMDDLGMPPLAYIHQLKIESARKRLITSMEKVSEIAYSLGFQDANYFSRLFRKKTGHSPNDYRNKYRNFNIEH